MYNWDMMKPAKKVFVSGSKSISALSIEFLKHLSLAIQERAEILVGDCYGVDTIVQNYLASINYPKCNRILQRREAEKLLPKKREYSFLHRTFERSHRTRIPIRQGY